MKELEHYYIGNSYGSCQDWFGDLMMNKGGCGAITACDICIYMAKYKGMKGLYPFDPNKVTKEDFLKFGYIMKPYLSPRVMGIHTTKLFTDGFEKYIAKTGEKLVLSDIQGFEPYETAKRAVKEQIDKGNPIACLLLYHKSLEFKNYEWHWFLLNGYEEFEDKFMVKAVTYSYWRWLDFEGLWNTGHKKKGGIVMCEKAE